VINARNFDISDGESKNSRNLVSDRLFLPRHHRLRGSTSTVNGERPSQWEMAKFDSYTESKPPKPFITKYGTIVYVHKETL